MRISDWSSDVCSSDLGHGGRGRGRGRGAAAGAAPDGHYAPAQRGPAFARGHARDRDPGKKAALAVAGGAAVHGRSEKRRLGKACGSPCRFRLSQVHEKTNTTTTYNLFNYHMYN